MKEKIVCIAKDFPSDSNHPKYMEEVEFLSSEIFLGDLCHVVKGYERDADHVPQVFRDIHFRVIKPHTFTNELTKELALEVLITEVDRIEEPEKELITNNYISWEN